MKNNIKLASEIKIGDRLIAKNQPVFVVAEIGSVHDGNFNLARELIKTAADCGADAVKFQIHIPEAETIIDAPMPSFFNSEPRFEYFKRTTFEEEQWKKIKDYAESLGVFFFASSFSIEATELLERLGVLLHKVPSGEVTNIPYLEHMAGTGKPIFLSSGMSNWLELDRAVDALSSLNEKLIPLQCVSEYPASADHIGLNLVEEMQKRYNSLVGFSDHSLLNYSAFGAVMAGARVVEKHFALKKDMYGSDAKHSLTPGEFKDLVNGIRFLEKVLSSPVDKDDLRHLKEMKLVFQKSIVASDDIPMGTVLEARHLSFKKPGDGLPPGKYKDIIGKKTQAAFKKDQKIALEDLV
jgi:N-acetylneuraminate synthase